jgi:hypothetical protein
MQWQLFKDEWTSSTNHSNAESPPYNASGEVIEKMHQATAQLKGDRHPGTIHGFVTLNRLACIPAAQSAILQARPRLAERIA